MKSKVNIKSHPLHPILVSFPIVLFTATLVFDILTTITGNKAFEKTGLYMNIGGIACALLAAVPGIIDYYFTVPPQSSAKNRAAKHGLLNISVTILFIIALFIRLKDAELYIPVLAIEIIAIALMLVAGWLGGTLKSDRGGHQVCRSREMERNLY